MSRTSSLLVALPYGLYESRPRNECSDGKLEKLFLSVVDTKDFPAGTFVLDLELLYTFVAEKQRLRKILRWRT